MSKKILLVDDDEVIRSTYAEVLRAEGFEVTEAVDGLDALEQAIKNIPDLIFTGIIMPRMDGFALKEELSKNVATSNIPVMISSHLGREEDKKRSQTMGFRDFLVQGMLTPRQIVSRIRLVLEPEGYKIKVNTNELDGPKLARDLHVNERFQCPKCQRDLVLSLNRVDADKREFTSKVVCPNCG